LISPVANAVAVPLFTLVLVPLVLIGTAVASVSLEAGSWLLHWSAQLLETCWPVMQWLARQPLAMWHLPEMPWSHHALLAAGTLLLVLPGPLPLRCAAAALCLPAALFQPPAPEHGAYELAMLDVGQGLAIVIRTQSHTLVYDAGPAFRTGRDAGELVLLPYLRTRGVRTIDRLVISHGDLDHEGGAKSLLLGVPIRSLLVGPSVQTAAHAAQCLDGQRWTWDGVVFEILHPGAGIAGASDNDTSCVLKVTGEGGTALITGDIEADAEAELLARSAVRADIVTVAHHGSSSSSTAAFVAGTRAQLALVSAGYRNRWNFPRPDVVERWRAAGAEVVATIDSGAIELSVRPNQPIAMRRFRDEHRRYWSSR
jgi:competence protein ComEC